MSDLLDLPALPADDAGFDASAFDAAFAAQRQLAAAGAYQASNDVLEQLLQDCPPSQQRRRRRGGQVAEAQGADEHDQSVFALHVLLARAAGLLGAPAHG